VGEARARALWTHGSSGRPPSHKPGSGPLVPYMGALSGGQANPGPLWAQARRSKVRLPSCSHRRPTPASRCPRPLQLQASRPHHAIPCLRGASGRARGVNGHHRPLSNRPRFWRSPTAAPERWHSFVDGPTSRQLAYLSAYHADRLAKPVFHWRRLGGPSLASPARSACSPLRRHTSGLRGRRLGATPWNL
jgi:hypothetical protein